MTAQIYIVGDVSQPDCTRKRGGTECQSFFTVKEATQALYELLRAYELREGHCYGFNVTIVKDESIADEGSVVIRMGGR